MAERMLKAFIEFERQHPQTLGLDPQQRLVGVPRGTRLYRIYRRDGYWQVWTATSDFVFGTYLCLHDDGRIVSITERSDEGPESFTVRPSDAEIKANG